ncbi:MAG: PadR family transcriptional regulator [Amphiplicatus sp.]
MALAHAILTALVDEELSGYDLAKRFDASLGHFWKATHQQIYKELAKLEQRALIAARVIEQQARPDRIVYAVTEAGLALLRDWATAPAKPAPVKEDLLVMCHALGLIPAETLRAQMMKRNAHARERLEMLQRLETKLFPDPKALTGRALGQYLSLRGGVRYERLWIEWTEECCAFLETRRKG